MTVYVKFEIQNNKLKAGENVCHLKCHGNMLAGILFQTPFFEIDVLQLPFFFIFAATLNPNWRKLVVVCSQYYCAGEFGRRDVVKRLQLTTLRIVLICFN